MYASTFMFNIIAPPGEDVFANPVEKEGYLINYFIRESVETRTVENAYIKVYDMKLEVSVVR